MVGVEGQAVGSRTISCLPSCVPTLVPAVATLSTLFYGSGLRHSVRSHDRDPRGAIHSRRVLLAVGLGPITDTAINAYETFLGGQIRKAMMPLFYTDSVTLSYSDVESAKRWWVEAFG